MDIHIPESVSGLAQLQATAAGYASVADYVCNLIHADQRRRTLDAKLVEGLRSGPAMPLEAADWDRLRDEVRARHESRHGAS